MLAISLGPVALPLAPVLLLAAVVAAQTLASRLARRPQAGDGEAPDRPAGRAAQAGDAFTTAALLGLLAARGVYVALHAEAYLAAPWSLIDVRDGGWHAGAGLAAGFGWLAWRGWQGPALRRSLAAGAVSGALLWFGLHAALAPSRGAPMPAVDVAALGSAGTLPLTQAAQGRPAVVVLWATWCAPCREEMPLLAAAQAREAGLHFLFVNQGETEATVRRYLASLPYPVQNVLLDAPSALGPAVGSPGLPTTLFYDAGGRQVDAHFGVLNAAALESRLGALRPAHPPRMPP